MDIKTALSVADFVQRLLTESEAVKATGADVFAVATDKATLPYVTYRRVGYDEKSVKGARGPATATVEAICYTREYNKSLELAEAVAGALVDARLTIGDHTLRSCILTQASEHWASDAYAQVLTFELKL